MVLCEGAGSPAEINLLDGDIVNLRVARDAGLPAIVVGDIDRGGVFAALYGTVALLPDDLRATVRGFVINKFRGDPAVLGDGPDELARRTGVPTLGVLPWLDGIGTRRRGLPGAGRRLAGSRRPPPARRLAAPCDVAAVRFPRISNFTDLDALAVEPAVRSGWWTARPALGRPDLLVLPGTKTTRRRPGLAPADAAWPTAIAALAADPAGRTTVLGICGGYQMLGTRIDDPVESRPAQVVAGLGLLPAETVFEPDKVVRWTSGHALGRRPFAATRSTTVGPGRPRPGSTTDRPGDGGGEGGQAAGGRIAGTSLHGLLEGDAFRSAFLAAVAGGRGGLGPERGVVRRRAAGPLRPPGRRPGSPPRPDRPGAAHRPGPSGRPASRAAPDHGQRRS